MEFSCKITVKCGEEVAKNIASALSHEGKVGRADARIFIKKDGVEIDIKALDAVSLRATANAFLRMLSIIDEVERHEKRGVGKRDSGV